tara:strand:+ start:894 stop:2951 length:2058 start_codon:yes stop_codon:yes gene_type:complete
MNVKDMVQEINAALDYNPELKQYTDSIVRCINRHYLQVSSQYQWLFMQEKKPLVLRADIESKNYDGTAATISFATNSCVGRLSNAIGSSVLHLPPDVVGQTLIITQSMSDATNTNFDHKREYRIVRYINPRCIIVDRPPSSDLAFDHDTSSSFQTVTTTGFTSWKIEYRKYPMPKNAVEILGVMDRGLEFSECLVYTKFASSLSASDWHDFEWYKHLNGATTQSETRLQTTTAPNDGRFVFLDARKEENIYLDRTDKGDSFVSVEEIYDNIDPPPAPTMISFDTITMDGETAGDIRLASLPDGTDIEEGSDLGFSMIELVRKELEAKLMVPEGFFENSDSRSASSFLTNTKGSLLLPGFTYEYCCTYEEFGIESPPSPVSSLTISLESQEVDTSPGNRSILLNCGSTLALRNEFSGFASKREFSSDFTGEGAELLKEKNLRSYRDTGRRIKIYRRVFEEKREPGLNDLKINKAVAKYNSMVHASFWRTTIGKWKHIATLSDATKFNDLGHDLLMSTQYMGVGHFAFREDDTDMPDIPLAYDGHSDTAAVGSDTFANYPIDRIGDPERVETLDETGPRQYLRFWKTPDSDYKVEVRYHRRPRRLQADQDTPEWPPQYHHYLVYAALKDICMQHGMTNHSTMYERRAEEILQRMKNKYLSRTDRIHIRRGFDRSMREREVFGVPSKS